MRDTVNLRASASIQGQLLKDQSTTHIQPLSQFQILNNARLLASTEYTFNQRLGYVSLNQALNSDDVLFVAFQYENTANGKLYQVGEFSSSIPQNPNKPNVLFLKMLKGPSQRPDLPIWKLMMKNIYSLGAYNVQSKDFKLNIIYADDVSGAKQNFLPVQSEPQLTGVPLLAALNLDNLNANQEKVSDGVFDFIEGVTIQSQQGRIIFPVLEPFGSTLAAKFKTDPTKARYYCYFELYDSTKYAALQLPQYDKFFLRGTYSGAASNVISVGQTNIPRGSVKVTANGALLTENQDYIVDYNLGRVTITNTGLLNSGAAITVSSETNSMFSVQQKSLLGSRFDYKYSNNLIFGGTALYLTERPLTQKVNIGDEPISNLMLGVDGSYKRDSRLITKLVDQLPFISTKEPSNISISGEAARLLPLVNSALAQNGTAYLDDFEGSETFFDLRLGNNWVLASTPQRQTDLFPEGQLTGDLGYGFKRANLAWYSISTAFTNDNDPNQPTHIQHDPDQLSSHCVRSVDIHEVYPNRQIQAGMPTLLPTLDLAFYPTERGPYNYTTDLKPDGSLSNPANNPTWGGIMRKIDQNDFEASNIDYIELWMMDPYLCNNAGNSGQLYINLGNISEDVLRDGRKSAENGLPIDPTVQATDTTVWGRVPITPPLNFAFDADPANRAKQDIGLDGLSSTNGSTDEQTFFDTSYIRKIKSKFGAGSIAYQNAIADPSNDDYHYYLGSDYDGASTSILNRYRKYNRHEGNSQVPVSGQNTTAATNIPDVEDINRDFTLNEIEEYYQYKIDISRNKLAVGQNYITDSATTPVTLKNGNTALVTWYQLKIPIREFQKSVGEIYDFKSIRFMRVFMRGFSDNMVLRFGAMNLVRADWRKYLGNLAAGQELKPADPEDDTKFDVSTVSIEKDGLRVPVQYSVPPGINRTIDFSTPNAIQQNEQSLSVKVCNLKDGDARAVFKNTKVDLRQYGTLRMFVHAEGDNLKDGEMHAFIRLGTDMTNNYYEYDLPLSVTQANHNDANSVWPAGNELTITLDDLIQAKIDRLNAGYALNVPYTKMAGNAKITVVGLPDLSNVRVAMIGVRNPKRTPGITDDGMPKCGEFWFDELRMTDFNNSGGWAANAKIQSKLADLGNVQLTGSVMSAGWGGIDKKLLERSMNDQYVYDLQSSFELGKFLPKTSGITIPMFFSYGNTLIRPLYDPLNPDTKLQRELNSIIDPVKRDQISRAADDFTARRGFNFSNVKKNRIGNTRKAQFYDIENFSATYTFAETFKRNQTLEYYLLQNYTGQINYTFTFGSKPLEPFKNLVTSDYLALIRDFNIYYLPQSWGFRFSANRRFSESYYRNNDATSTELPPTYDKLFTMTRYYEFRYDLAKSLKFDYNATVLSRIDEPQGKIDAQTKSDSIWNNFWNGGKVTQFDQMAKINYTLPIAKIPFLNFIEQPTYSYTANYQWKAAPPAADSLGNKIQNSRVQTAGLTLNFMKLYNKISYLNQVNNPGQKLQKPPKKDLKNKSLISKNKKPGDTEDKVEMVEPAKKPPMLVYTLKFLMMLKSVNVNFTQNEGTVMPGFVPSPRYLGENYDRNAPGFAFIAGMQDPNYRQKAADNGWLSNDPRVIDFYTQDFRRTITGRAMLEPIADLRIELNISQTQTQTSSTLFKYDTASQTHRDMTPYTESGNYSITYNVWPTTFSKENSNGVSNVFQQFEDNRIIIANRLAEQNKNSRPAKGVGDDGFPIGYSRTAQDVLIPAFLSAYSGGNPNNIDLTPFPKIPIPNWKISYTGLSKIPILKDYVKNITLNNQYTSNYNVNSYVTTWDSSGTRGNVAPFDYLPQYQISTVSIVERWIPFFGIDITFVKNITTKIEYKRDRTMTLSLTNQQMTEQQGSEFVIGAGYRTSKLAIPVNLGGRRLVLNNDINFRFDFSIRDQITLVRRIDVPSNDPMLGQNIMRIAPTIEYMINTKLMLKIFYERRSTTPYTSTSFPTIIQSGGFSLRYTIQ
ncbi:MAG: cell surface protein SprA [Bacteroidia bacterium]